MSLGYYGTFPFDLGGGSPQASNGSVLEAEHQALLDELAPGWDVGEDTGMHAEARAYAQIVTTIWAINRRMKNWLLPESMLESLPVWEDACGLRPSKDDSLTARRKRVAGKLLGLASNAIGAIESAAVKVLGAAFDGLVLTDPADDIVYWPGVNPGPPGFEWSTNRVRFGVRINPASLNDKTFDTLRQDLFLQLDAMIPAWMSFVIGAGSAFTVGLGIVGQTIL